MKQTVLQLKQKVCVPGGLETIPKQEDMAEMRWEHVEK